MNITAQFCGNAVLSLSNLAMGHAIADRLSIPQVISERKDAAGGRKTERDASTTADEVKHKGRLALFIPGP